ncbi:zinc ribbon domain-containing protein [Thermopirellula anaerolimosa]
MAKKALAGNVVLGRGRKLCPDCGKVVAARANQCEHCGHQFVAKRGRRVRRVAVRAFHRPNVKARAVPAPDAEDKVIEFANQHGGLKSATQLVEDVLRLKTESGLDVEMIQSELQRLGKILANIQQ